MIFGAGPWGLLGYLWFRIPLFLVCSMKELWNTRKRSHLFANNMPVPRFGEGFELWLEGSRLSMNKTHHDNHCSFHLQLIQRQISRLEAARWGHGVVAVDLRELGQLPCECALACAAHTVHWKCTRESMRCLQTKAIILQRRQSLWTQQQTSSSYATFIYNIRWCNDVSHKSILAYHMITVRLPYHYLLAIVLPCMLTYIFKCSRFTPWLSLQILYWSAPMKNNTRHSKQLLQWQTYMNNLTIWYLLIYFFPMLRQNFNSNSKLSHKSSPGSRYDHWGAQHSAILHGPTW